MKHLRPRLDNQTDPHETDQQAQPHQRLHCLRNHTSTTSGMKRGAALASSTASISASDFTAMKKSNWQIDPARLRKICNPRWEVFRRAGPCLSSAGAKTRKLMPYW